MSKNNSNNYSTIRNRIAKEYKNKIDELTTENRNLRSKVVNNDKVLKELEDELAKVKKELLILKVFGKFTESDLHYVDLLTKDTSVLNALLGKKGVLGCSNFQHSETTDVIIDALGKLL